MATPNAPVLLGFPGRMVGGGERLDHYTTKVGGAPHWPAGTSSSSASNSQQTSATNVCAAAAAGAAADVLDGDATATQQEQQPQAPPSEMTACGKCAAAMALVVQAHAPLNSGELPGGAIASDRTLYLFTCFNPSCPGAGKNAGRWRALRAQRSVTAASTATAVAAAAVTGEEAAQQQQQQLSSSAHPTILAADEGAPVSSAVAMDDDWGAGAGADDWGAGAGADDWGGTTTAAAATGEASLGAAKEEGGDAFGGGGGGGDDWGGGGAGVDEEMDDLANALDALATTAAVASSGGGDKGGGCGGKGKGGRGGRVKGGGSGGGEEDVGEDDSSSAAQLKSKWPGPLLPEFYVVADWEPDAEKAMTASEAADAERLLAQYAAAEGIASASDSTASAAAAAAAAAAASGGGAEWTGESYEKSVVEGLDKKYLKFSKRLRRAPEVGPYKLNPVAP
jgi:pre-rRNA-processing protein TSR4